MTSDEIRRDKARNLRYMRCILAGYNLQDIQDRLYTIASECDEIRYYVDGDEDTLINALDGDEEDAYEFKFAFADLSANCDKLNDLLHNEYVNEYFDEFFVACASGAGYKMLGYDGYEEDYYTLCAFEAGLGQIEADKRIKRLTKDELIRTAGQCFGIMVSFLSIRTEYESLKAAFDILRNDNTSLLQRVKDIDAAYNAAADDDFCGWHDSTSKFDSLIAAMPERLWVE